MKTNLEDLTRDELKSIANEKGIDFPKNIKTDALISLLKEDKEQTVKQKMNKPKEGKEIQCVIRNLDPNNPMNVCEVGVNGYFISIPLDKEVKISNFFFGTIKSAYWVKPILDENGQVIRTEKRPKYSIEIV